ALEQLGYPLAGTGLLTDYLKLDFPGPVLAPPRADRRSFQAAAAGILAKTTRDAWMRELAEREPAYGFDRHKGYGTPAHRRALERFGPCSEHRLTFAPVGRYAKEPVRPATMRGKMQQTAGTAHEGREHPGPAENSFPATVGVRLPNGPRLPYVQLPGGAEEPERDSRWLVRTRRGPELGLVRTGVKRDRKAAGRLLRPADDADFEQEAHLQQKAEELKWFVRARARQQ